MKFSWLKFFFVFAVAGMFWGCQPVKPYQRVYLDDRDMQPGTRGGAAFEVRSEAYREGATGGGGGKASGGCGCN